MLRPTENQAFYDVSCAWKFWFLNFWLNSLVSSWWRHREAWVSPKITHERKAQALRHSGFMGCYDSCRIPQWQEEPGTLNRSSTSWCTAPLTVRYDPSPSLSVSRPVSATEQTWVNENKFILKYKIKMSCILKVFFCHSCLKNDIVHFN